MAKIKIKLGEAWQLDWSKYEQGAEVEIDEDVYKSMKDHVKHSVVGGDKPVTDKPKDK